MIKLKKSPTIPLTLQSDAIEEQNLKLQTITSNGETPQYTDFRSDLYGAKDVRTQLLKDQNDKCAYCECTLLDKEGGEIDHFRPKTAYRQDTTPKNTTKPAYYQLAYCWENLLLSCHVCNRHKGTFFPLSNPDQRFDLEAEDPLLINPYREDPTEYLEFRRAHIYPKNDHNEMPDHKGEVTIQSLDLNRKDLVEKRRRILHNIAMRMEREGVSFDEIIRQEIDDAIRDGRKAESIEHYGLLINQKYKF